MGTLTGNFYHKKTWFGLVLMVEVENKTGVIIHPSGSYETNVYYRKANELDLKQLTLKNESILKHS